VEAYGVLDVWVADVAFRFEIAIHHVANLARELKQIAVRWLCREDHSLRYS